MRLIIIGCEFSGKSTLAARIKEWGEEAFGGLTSSFHDHFVFPDAEANAEEQKQLMDLVPSLKEKYQRYMINYHFNPAFYSDNDHCMVGFYYSEAVYAPLYYEYGRPGEYADRAQMARTCDHEVMQIAPDTVLVLMKASPEVIKQRIAAHPETKSVLQEKDVEFVLNRFDELFSGSLIRRKFELDTSTSSIDDTFAEFLKKMEPHFTTIDRLRMLTRISN
jgi:thymidylate kinase